MDSSKEISHVTSRSGKKDSPGFLHDSNARHDQKILRLRQRGGWHHYGLYWACIEIMRESSDLEIADDAVEALAYSLHEPAPTFQIFLNGCVGLGLFEKTETGFCSPSLIARMERFEEAREKKKAAGKASAEKRAQAQQLPPPPAPTPVQHPLNTCSTPVQQKESVCSTPPIQIQTQLEQQTEIQTEPETEPPSPPLPESIPDPDPYLSRALEALMPVEECENSTLFINTGRRPHQRFPEIWLTPGEYADVLRQYAEAGVAHKLLDQAKLVAAKLRTVKGAGKTTDNISAYCWLIGWALDSALGRETNLTRLETQELYHKQAKARK